MSAVGVIDYMDLVTAVTRHIDKITPRYRCILVEEAQDFGSVELSILRKLAKQDKTTSFSAATPRSPFYQSINRSTPPVST